jgi:phosphosulfolactate synthase
VAPALTVPEAVIRRPERPGKPRREGLTHVLDKGVDLQRLKGVLEDHAPLIDLLKFGWGTALVSPNIAAKIALCRAHAITPVLGGTLFEYCLITDQYSSFLHLLDELELGCVEVSNGAGAITQERLAACVRELARDRRVLQEIGFKSERLAQAMGREVWLQQMEDGFAAGASMIILEARESGRSGFCTTTGEPRLDLCDDVIERFGTDALMFEAPTARLQVALIKAYGHQLNLANISMDDPVALETLRLGLRFDTLPVSMASPAVAEPGET